MTVTLSLHWPFSSFLAHKLLVLLPVRQNHSIGRWKLHGHDTIPFSHLAKDSLQRPIAAQKWQATHQLPSHINYMVPNFPNIIAGCQLLIVCCATRFIAFPCFPTDCHAFHHPVRTEMFTVRHFAYRYSIPHSKMHGQWCQTLGGHVLVCVTTPCSTHQQCNASPANSPNSKTHVTLQVTLYEPKHWPVAIFPRFFVFPL